MQMPASLHFPIGPPRSHYWFKCSSEESTTIRFFVEGYEEEKSLNMKARKAVKSVFCNLRRRFKV
jgi:hypothetical protein